MLFVYLYIVTHSHRVSGIYFEHRFDSFFLTLSFFIIFGVVYRDQ